MPIGTLGILLCITFFGAMISQLTLIPLADRFGRKFLFEISLLIMIVSSMLSVNNPFFFSVFSFFLYSISLPPFTN
jgi:MFS family permease